MSCRPLFNEWANVVIQRGNTMCSNTVFDLLFDITIVLCWSNGFGAIFWRHSEKKPDCISCTHDWMMRFLYRSWGDVNRPVCATCLIIFYFFLNRIDSCFFSLCSLVFECLLRVHTLWRGAVNSQWFSGMVGPPLSCCAIKLVDIPEMDYFARDNKGEVSVWIQTA